MNTLGKTNSLIMESLNALFEYTTEGIIIANQSGTIIRANKFNSTGITGANSGDSWMDIKGNYCLIENNVGFNPQGSILKDGYQVHCVVNGWGCYNVFKNNNSVVNASGYGINVTLTSSKGKVVGNKVYASNTAEGAVKGISNIELMY